MGSRTRSIAQLIANTFANSTIGQTLTTQSDVAFANISATRITATITGNSSVAGVLQVVDSTSNSSATVAASANSAKVAYDTAVTSQSMASAAYSNAISTAAGYASVSYANAISYAASVSAAAYTNAVAYAASNTYVNSTFAPKASPTISGVLTVSGNTSVSGSVQIDGDLIVSGNTISVSTSTMSVTDNMVYMNNGISANVTGISSNGTVVVFAADNNFAGGWDVTVTGVDPTSYNGTYNNITSANATHFVVANTNTAAYVSGGVARGKTDVNPDIGFAAGYNDGSYHHAGFFRDATDGVWKVFDNYQPEPDDDVYINTSHASFHVADFQANAVTVASLNTTGTVSANVLSVSNVEQTQTNLQVDPAGSAFLNAIIYG